MDYPCSICCIAGYRTLFPPPQQTASRLGVAVNPMASFILQTIIYGATIVMAIVSFWHLLPRKQLCPKGEKRKIRKSLLRILRHFGGFFLTSFLGMIIVGIATFIAALPSIILIIARSIHSSVHLMETRSVCRVISPHSSSWCLPSPSCSSSTP